MNWKHFPRLTIMDCAFPRGILSISLSLFVILCKTHDTLGRLLQLSSILLFWPYLHLIWKERCSKTGDYMWCHHLQWFLRDNVFLISAHFLYYSTEIIQYLCAKFDNAGTLLSSDKERGQLVGKYLTLNSGMLAKITEWIVRTLFILIIIQY